MSSPKPVGQEIESENDSDQPETHELKLISTMAPDALPHTDLLTILTAAGSSQQVVSIHKNIEIQDASGIFPEDINGHLISVQFSPQKPEMPELSGMLMGTFVEDHNYGTLTFHISKDTDKLSPYYMKLNVINKTQIDVSIRATITDGKTEDYLALDSYLQKMKYKEYRRFVIVNSDGEQLLTSSCPNMSRLFSSLELEIVTKINRLEKLSGEYIGIPYYSSDEFLSALNQLLDSWGGLTDEQRQKKTHSFKELHNVVYFTAYKIVLKGEQDEMFSLLFSEERGFINYNSFGVSVRNGAMRTKWQRLAKDHGAMQIHMRNRRYSAEELFSTIYRNMTDRILLKTVMSLNDHPPLTVPSFSKSRITIDFKAPVQYGWCKVQLINIEIGNVDPSLNKLEELLFESNYIEAIPYLELYKDNYIEDLAYAYVLNDKYEDAISCANEAIALDIRSVGHFTKGLANCGLGDFEEAYECYQLAVHAYNGNWHPVAKENLERLVQTKNINTNGVYDDIIRLLDLPSNTLSDNERCYCGSRRKFKKCHGKQEN